MFFAKPYTFVINRDKFRTTYKLLRIEKVDFLKKYPQECSQETLDAAMNHHDSVFSLFFISLDRFKTESGEFRTGRKGEIFTRLRAAYVVFKKNN